MNAKLAWIDDVRLLVVEIEDMSNFICQIEKPYIVWQSKNIIFEAEINQIIDNRIINIRFFEDLPMGEELSLHWGLTTIPIYPRDIVRTAWFDKHYSYTDAKLGANCGKNKTFFSLWAPTATNVKLYLNNDFIPLNRQTQGVWTCEVFGDWHGFTYQYEITVNGETILVNDPYAKTMLVNSEKGVSVDFSRTLEKSFIKPSVKDLQDSIIYELHIRDATIQKESGVINRGKFLGLTEKNTTSENGYSTALAYMKELGITHVQLLPINDFCRVDEADPKDDYNWGYDPLYFQSPEGSYSTSPEDPMARINECKQMIQAFHEEGICVILDVVYNHVFIMEDSAFEKIVPGYYFRYHPDGRLSNGTRVGNDLATERNMVRKFILDTIDLWLDEYEVDGFRFDLMGAIDIETMQQIRERCARESSPIMLLGEGWNLQTALTDEKKASSFNAQQLKGIRFFNDQFRDTIKGNLFDTHETGYINGNGRFVERMSHLVSGSALIKYGDPFVSDVKQTINYVECHDNHTLWDRLQLTNPYQCDEEKKKMHQLATGIVLLSQGVPFIHSGQEWFRTKQGDGNSYLSGDQINQLDWTQREKENEQIKFIKALIALRKKYDVFRLRNNQDVQNRFHLLNTPAPLFGYTLLGTEDDFSIYINPTKEEHDVQLPSLGNWKICVTNHEESKNPSHIKEEYTKIYPYELIVLKKSRK